MQIHLAVTERTKLVYGPWLIAISRFEWRTRLVMVSTLGSEESLTVAIPQAIGNVPKALHEFWSGR
jgi:hypothetical protein